jgi:hypothetical protein
MKTQKIIFELFKKWFILISIFIYSTKVFSQKDSNYFLFAQAAAGTSVPFGSFSKKSSRVNSIGKYQWSFGINLRVEGVLENKYTLGIAIDYDFCTIKNENLVKQLEDKYASKKKSVILKYASSDVDLVIQRYSAAASRIFIKNKFIFQPKIYLSLCVLDFDFNAYYVLEQPGSSSSSPWPNSTTKKSYTYSADNAYTLNASPELNVKYIILDKTWLDLALNIGVRFTYMRPKIQINEEISNFGAYGSGSKTLYTTLKDPVVLLNAHVGVLWLF